MPERATVSSRSETSAEVIVAGALPAKDRTRRCVQRHGDEPGRALSAGVMQAGMGRSPGVVSRAFMTA